MSNLTDADKVLRNDTGISIANRLSEIAATLDSQGGTSLAATDIADLYDNTKTYIVGDYVINNQALYRCIEDITAPEDFDSTKWRAIKIMSAVNEEIDAAISPLLPVDEAQGDIATFETNLAEPLHSVKCEINATGGNGTPDNPNPIVGYTEANIVNTQNESIANLFSIDSDFRGTVVFNQNIATTSGNQSTVSVLSDGVYKATSNGKASYFGFGLYDNSNAIFKPIVGHKYYLRFNLVDVSISDANVLTSGNGINSTYTPTVGIKEKVIQASANVATYINFSTNGTSLATDNFTIKDVNIIDLTQMFGATIADYIYSLEQNNAGAGSTFFRNIYPEDYYAYDSGTTEIVGKETPEAVISFGQTVYGGVLDVTRGKLHVTHYGVEYDGTEDGWSWYGDYQQASIALPYPAKYEIDNITYKCNRLTPVLNQSRPQNIGNYASLISSGANGAFSTPETSLANFKTWLGSNHIQFVYELDTPIDIDLTPVQISALVGTNNIISDCNGDVNVSYKDSIQHYIDKKIASI